MYTIGKCSPEAQKKFGSLASKRYLVFLDLEMTCDEDGVPFDQELLEVGVVIVDLSRLGVLEIDEYETLVKPPNTKITKYCENLTGISQVAVDRYALDFKSFSEEFQDVLPTPNDFVFVSWGSDPEFLEREYIKRNLPYPFDPRYVNFKMFLQKGTSLLKALEEREIRYIRPIHRALTDAKNLYILWDEMGSFVTPKDAFVSRKRTYRESEQEYRDLIVKRLLKEYSSLDPNFISTLAKNLGYKIQVIKTAIDTFENYGYFRPQEPEKLSPLRRIFG